MNGKQLRRSAAVVLALPMVALAVLVAVPPWCARMPCIVQARIGGWTGIYFHHFPRDFTGTLRLWDERGRLLFEHPYRNGLREGTWFKYEEDGRKVTLGEYRDGEPWDGVCFIYDEKAWIGEYRQGQPWNGCLPVHKMDRTDWRYFIDGQEVTESNTRVRSTLRRIRVPSDFTALGHRRMQ